MDLGDDQGIGTLSTGSDKSDTVKTQGTGTVSTVVDSISSEPAGTLSTPSEPSLTIKTPYPRGEERCFSISELWVYFFLLMVCFALILFLLRITYHENKVNDVLRKLIDVEFDRDHYKRKYKQADEQLRKRWKRDMELWQNAKNNPSNRSSQRAVMSAALNQAHRIIEELSPKGRSLTELEIVHIHYHLQEKNEKFGWLNTEQLAVLIAVFMWKGRNEKKMMESCSTPAKKRISFRKRLARLYVLFNITEKEEGSKTIPLYKEILRLTEELEQNEWLQEELNKFLEDPETEKGKSKVKISSEKNRPSES